MHACLLATGTVEPQYTEPWYTEKFGILKFPMGKVHCITVYNAKVLGFDSCCLEPGELDGFCGILLDIKPTPPAHAMWYNGNQHLTLSF